MIVQRVLKADKLSLATRYQAQLFLSQPQSVPLGANLLHIFEKCSHFVFLANHIILLTMSYRSFLIATACSVYSEWKVPKNSFSSLKDYFT